MSDDEFIIDNENGESFFEIEGWNSGDEENGGEGE